MGTAAVRVWPLKYPFATAERGILGTSAAAYKESLKVPSCTLLFQGVLLRHKAPERKAPVSFPRHRKLGILYFRSSLKTQKSSKEGTQRRSSWSSSLSPGRDNGSSSRAEAHSCSVLGGLLRTG